MPPQTEKHTENWHLDKKVPIAIILAIVVQTSGLIWWAATLNSRVSSLEARDSTQQTLIDSRAKLADDRWENFMRERDRMARLEEKLAAAVDMLKRIETKLDRVESRP